MPISQVSLNQTMRPGEISAINALNEVITLVNNLDLSGVNTRLTGLESDITTNANNITTNASDIDALEADMADVKATLYTPLNQTVPDPS